MTNVSLRTKSEKCPDCRGKSRPDAAGPWERGYCSKCGGTGSVAVLVAVDRDSFHDDVTIQKATVRNV